jgi:tetratricopeptide (TPR) repeat protein
MRLPRTDLLALPPEEVVSRLEQAARLSEASFTLAPDSDWIPPLLALTYRHLAVCYVDAGRLADALRAARRAAEVQLARPTGSSLLELERLDGVAQLASLEEQAKEPAAARSHARDVADGFETFCRTHSADPLLSVVAIDYCRALAPPLRQAGATDQSRRVAECALRLAQQRANSNPDTAHLRLLSEAWVQLAKCHIRDEPASVEAALVEAITAARRLVALDKRNRSILDDRLRRTARHLGGEGPGQRAKAAEYLRECEHLWPDDADGLHGVALTFRALADDVSKGRTELSPAERDERQQYLAEAARLEKAADALRPSRK